MKIAFAFIVLLSLSYAKYSYSDKCYRYVLSESPLQKSYFQIYINKKGIPLSNDIITHQYIIGDNSLAVQYYYHQILSDCTKKGNDFDCTLTVQSIWFNVVNATAAKWYVTSCDPIFYEKYADITKNKCDHNGKDPFIDFYKIIGSTSPATITMSKDGVPVFDDYKQDGECVWEYEILGLWSIVAIVVLVSCIVGALLFIIVIWVIAQKHRSNKRKRLDNALISNKETQI